jgi:L-asparaginase/Glu-tRNA(Gln) amidotransferase subunit D
MGTDTVDIVLPFIDVFTFDKDLSPVIFTGANLSHNEPNSDAPRNFLNLAKAANFQLSPGAYYVFDNKFFLGSDIAKIDPSENPTEIDGSITFYSPHRLSKSLQNFSINNPSNKHKKEVGSLPEHYSPVQILKKLNRILVICLENLTSIDDEIIKIKNVKKYDAILIESFALGNAPNPIKKALSEIAGKKLILNISRCLVADTSNRYSSSLEQINTNSESQIMSGGKMSKSVGLALLTRILLEEMTNDQASKLLTKYKNSRLS